MKKKRLGWGWGGSKITNGFLSPKSYQLSLSKAPNSQSLQQCCSVVSSKIMIILGSSQVYNYVNGAQGYSKKKKKKEYTDIKSYKKITLT